MNRRRDSPLPESRRVDLDDVIAGREIRDGEIAALIRDGRGDDRLSRSKNADRRAGDDATGSIFHCPREGVGIRLDGGQHQQCQGQRSDEVHNARRYELGRITTSDRS
jgi:hypothetical protein